MELASRFRSWEGRGDSNRQQRLRAVAQQLRSRLIRRYRAGILPVPDVWFTYHLYHKAPDWLGPHVCQLLHIPYLVAEASHAPKQANGPWADGYQASGEALKQASAVIALNRADIPCIEPWVTRQTKLVHLKPFHEITSVPAGPSRDATRRRLSRELATCPSGSWLLTVGMMRPGAKLASFELLAKALEKIKNLDWQLIIVGDGVDRYKVEQAFQPVKERVFFAGLRSAQELVSFYAAADVFLWPAINEAYGMAILEAQSAGLPVVAGNVGGVPDIVRDTLTGTLVPAGQIAPFAEATGQLLSNPERCREMGKSARRIMMREHDLASASRVLGKIVEQVSDV